MRRLFGRVSCASIRRRPRAGIASVLVGLTLAADAHAFVPQVDWDPDEVPQLPAFDDGGRANALRAEAYRALRQNDWRRAMSIGREWVRLDPEDDFPWVLQAWAHAENNDYPNVVAAYNRAIDINPQQRYPVWRSLGVAYTVLHRYDYAVTAYARATEIDPSEPRAWNDLCEAQLRNDNPAAALGSAQQALLREADYAEAWSCRGQALMREKRLDEALSAFRRAIDGKTLDPRTDRANFWASLGWVYHQLNRADGVQEAVEGIHRWNADAAARFREQFMAGREDVRR
ncbi:MAG TPA: tetratricopeptide repeat protein [Rhodocyclaceae bacterium]|nr:tetratricopeptide repeat protein [Rhodocyclaceae bacterium]